MSILHCAHLSGFANRDLFWSQWIKFNVGPRSRAANSLSSMLCRQANAVLMLIPFLVCQPFGLLIGWMWRLRGMFAFCIVASIVFILTPSVGVLGSRVGTWTFSCFFFPKVRIPLRIRGRRTEIIYALLALCYVRYVPLCCLRYHTSRNGAKKPMLNHVIGWDDLYV